MGKEKIGEFITLFEDDLELYEQIYQLLNAEICRAVNGSMVVREPTSKTILNKQRKLVLEKDLDPDSPEREHMQMLGQPSRIMSSLYRGKEPNEETDRKYLIELIDRVMIRELLELE